MNPPKEPISEQVSRLAADALAAQARLMKDSVELGREAWSPGADQAALGRAWADLVLAEGQKYWQSVAVIGLDAARELLALNSRASAVVLRGLSEATNGRGTEVPRERPGRRSTTADGAPERREPAAGNPAGSEPAAPNPAAPEPASAATPHPVVAITAPVGGTARGSISVVNSHPRARRVTLAASALRDVAHDQPCAAQVGLEPGSVTIPAGAERIIELTVPLVAGQVEPGHAYAGQIEVSGGDERTIDLVVTVEAD